MELHPISLARRVTAVAKFSALLSLNGNFTSLTSRLNPHQPRFLDSFLVLLGAALASADTFAARLRFGRFIGMVSAEENTYFLRAFEALGVTETRRAADPDTQPTIGFKAIMREAADTRSYAAALSVLVVAEWLYLDWASRAPQPLPNNFVHAEWITLHDNPDFRGFVDFLRAELDRVGPAHADLCRDFFSRAVALELSFFEAAYATDLTWTFSSA